MKLYPANSHQGNPELRMQMLQLAVASFGSPGAPDAASIQARADDLLEYLFHCQHNVVTLLPPGGGPKLV